MNSRDTVLAATPYAGLIAQSVLIDDAVVAEALAEVAARGIRDVNDSRVVAYAYYAGVNDTIPMDLFRQAGVLEVVRRDLSMHAPRSYVDYDRTVDWVEDATLMDLTRWFCDTSIGWSLAVLHLAFDADASAVFAAAPLSEDGTLLIPILALSFFIPNEAREPLLTRLIMHDDPFTRACGKTLAMRYLRDAVLQHASAQLATGAIRSAEKTWSLAALGSILDDFGRWLEDARLDEKETERANEILAELRELGEALVKSVEDLAAVLDAAGPRQVQVLAAIAHWRVPDEAKAAIGAEIQSRVDVIFDRQFASVLDRPQAAVLRDALYPEWLTMPLTVALGASGLSPQRFQRAYDGLAADAFSRMTRYAVWLHDRRRAVALIAIVGCAAKNRGDHALLDAVKGVAKHALSQPSLDREVYPTGEVSKALGFDAPDA